MEADTLVPVTVTVTPDMLKARQPTLAAVDTAETVPAMVAPAPEVGVAVADGAFDGAVGDP
jgi:hypothetical protein